MNTVSKPIVASTLYRQHLASHPPPPSPTNQTPSAQHLASKPTSPRHQAQAKLLDRFATNFLKDDGYEPAPKRPRLDLPDDEIPRLVTGLGNDVDSHVLQGGLLYTDGIVGLATAPEVDGEVLPLSLLAEHLLSGEHCRAFYIDAETSVSAQKLRRLHGMLCSKARARRRREALKHNGGFVYARDEECGEEEVGKEADAAMERLTWMRVLDFEGMVEAVDEIAAVLRKGASHEQRESAEDKVEIADSEDEDASVSPPAQPSAPDTQPQNPTLMLTSPLPRLITPLMHTNHVAGHCLLSNLLRTLRHLIIQHPPLLVILANAVVPTRSAQYGKSEKRGAEVSAFVDVHIRPAMGRLFEGGLDLSGMVWGAGRLGGGSAEGDGEKEKRIAEEKRVVLEILHDRLRARGGRWGVFEVDGLS